MNIDKKYKQYNKTKRKAKITSIILILFILMSNTFATNALTVYENGSQKPNDINTSFEVAQTNIWTVTNKL